MATLLFFTLGIAAKNAGLTALQAALASITCHASAGEFAGFTLIAALAAYTEIAVMELIINARYFLMSCALSQKLDNKSAIFYTDLLWGLFVTDEIFGLTVSVPEKSSTPAYMYGIGSCSLTRVGSWNILRRAVWKLYFQLIL